MSTLAVETKTFDTQPREKNEGEKKELTTTEMVVYTLVVAYLAYIVINRIFPQTAIISFGADQNINIQEINRIGELITNSSKFRSVVIHASSVNTDDLLKLTSKMLELSHWYQSVSYGFSNNTFKAVLHPFWLLL